ncbi:MAG: hypothetical protein ACRC9R_04105 [Enterovibrio sp.]
MSGDFPLSSRAAPLNLGQLRALRAGIYGDVRASSLTELFVSLRNAPSVEPTTHRANRLEDLQDQLLISSEFPEPTTAAEYTRLRQQILNELRNFRSSQAASLLQVADRTGQTATQAHPARPSSAPDSNFYARSRELQASSSFTPLPVTAAQQQTAEQALRLVSRQLGNAEQLGITLRSPQSLLWFHHLHTMVNAQFYSCSFADDVAVNAFLQPEGLRQTLQLVVASLRGYAAALEESRGGQLREQLEAILQQNIRHNAAANADRVNLHELIFSHEAQNLFAVGRLRIAANTGVSVQENHPQTRLALKRNILALVRLFMQTYREICYGQELSASASGAPSRAPTPDLPPAGAVAPILPTPPITAGVDPLPPEPESGEETVSPEHINRCVNNFLGYLQRSLSLVALEEANPASIYTREQLMFARDNIEMFQRIYHNWTQFLAILSSTEDLAVRQTRASQELRVAIHLDNEALVSNLRWAIPLFFEHIDSPQLTINEVISRFATDLPCLEARACRLILGPEENNEIERAVNATKSKVDNVGLYCSKFAQSNPADPQNALACYEWAINQDAFIGASALDGNISAKDVFNYLIGDPLYINDFTDDSLEALKARYQALFDNNS